MNYFLVALQILTVIPVKIDMKRSINLSKSMICFPLVGLIIGFVLVTSNVIFNKFLSIYLSSALILFIWVIVTGALHLDGFADTVDAIFGASDKEGIMKIMQDVHIGAKAVIFLICLLLLKFITIVELPINLKNYALLFSPILSRWSMVFAAFINRYPKENGLGKDFIGNVKLSIFSTASIFMFITGILLFKMASLSVILAAIFVVLMFTIFFRSRIGGLTGDNVGAINEIVEVVSLIIFNLLK